jgi:hypothetical protein
MHLTKMIRALRVHEDLLMGKGYNNHTPRATTLRRKAIKSTICG